MAKRFFTTLYAAFILVCLVNGQAVDTSLAANPDTTLSAVVYADSNLLRQYQAITEHKSFLLKEDKPVVVDVQQFKSTDDDAFVFFLLMVMLGVLTYVKIAFGKEVEELLQSFVNSNIAQQIFRTQSNELSFSSFLLHANFIIAVSLYVQFILVNCFHVIALKSFSSILALIFLFTFFYVGKLIALKFIGVVFEVQEECNEYAFDYSTQCKIVGLTLIPALFIFHTTQEKFYNLIFIFSIFIAAAVAIIFVWRGLSTGIKIMYKSVYHFFIYVCVVEVSPIFLLFKLLTKTIT